MCKAVDEARKRVENGITEVGVYQDRPITIVCLEAVVDGKFYCAIDWSKVMWDDRWMPERGKKVAVGKATKRIARAVVSGEELRESFTIHPCGEGIV